MSKNKHLTLDDRIEIQECLAKGMTFKAIANRFFAFRLSRVLSSTHGQRYFPFLLLKWRMKG